MQNNISTVSELEENINTLVDEIFIDFEKQDCTISSQNEFENSSGDLAKEVFEQFKKLHTQKQGKERVKTYFSNKLDLKLNELLAQPNYIDIYRTAHIMKDELDEGEGFFISICRHCERTSRNDVDDVVQHCTEVRGTILAINAVGSHHSDMTTDFVNVNMNEPQSFNSSPIQSNQGISISGSSLIVNIGNTGNISNTLSSDNTATSHNVDGSIHQLIDLFKANEEIEFNQREEIVELLRQLNNEALKPTENRLPKSVLKSIIKSISDTVNFVGSAASITGINITNIQNFFK